MKKIALGLFILSLTNIALADNVIYRYKDAKGRTVYSDRLPPTEKSQIDVLSSKSVMLKKVIEKELNPEEYAARDEKLAQEAKKAQDSTLQRQKDQNLLITYSNINEIEKMKKYELDQIETAIRNDVGNVAVLTDRKAQLEKEYSTYKDNRKVPAKLDQDYKKLMGDLDVVNANLNKNKEMYGQREKKYNEDKARYTQVLKEMAEITKENKEK